MRERHSRGIYDGERKWIENFRLAVSLSFSLLPALLSSLIMGLVVSVPLVPCINSSHDHILEKWKEMSDVAFCVT